MSTFLTRLIFSESTPPSRRFQYGFLAAVLVLLMAFAVIPSRHYFRGFVVPLMLLFNHLAFQFSWPRAAGIALHVVALLWMVFACTFILYQIFKKG